MHGYVVHKAIYLNCGIHGLLVMGSDPSENVLKFWKCFSTSIAVGDKLITWLWYSWIRPPKLLHSWPLGPLGRANVATLWTCIDLIIISPLKLFQLWEMNYLHSSRCPVLRNLLIMGQTLWHFILLRGRGWQIYSEHV